MSTDDRKQARTKRNSNGAARGRPSGDGIEDMPSPYRRETKPSATTLDIVKRVLLASRLSDRGRGTHGKIDSFFDHFEFSKAEQNPDAADAVRRWLQDPARSNPPERGIRGKTRRIKRDPRLETSS